jgi:hypothetical protein
VYAFDTGFVSYARGWDPLRSDDLGLLWEHLVLEQLWARFPGLPARYWRDKTGRNVVNLHKLFPAAKLTLFSRLPAGLTTGQNHVIRKLFTISKLLAKITKNNQK